MQIPDLTLNKGMIFIISMNGYNVIKGILGIAGIFGGIMFCISAISMIVYKLKKNNAKAKKYAVSALASIILIAVGFVGSFAVAVEQYKFDFNKSDTFQVYSDDIADGIWNNDISNQADGQNLSPELHWEAVQGANIYYVYMIDETADNWLHWEIDGIPYTDISKGLCDDEYKTVMNVDDYEVKGQYIGPYPPYGTHTYTVYVFALKNEPFGVDATNFDGSGNDIAQIAEELNSSPYTDYNNLIGYGKISASYTARQD